MEFNEVILKYPNGDTSKPTTVSIHSLDAIRSSLIHDLLRYDLDSAKLSMDALFLMRKRLNLIVSELNDNSLEEDYITANFGKSFKKLPESNIDANK